MEFDYGMECDYDVTGKPMIWLRYDGYNLGKCMIVWSGGIEGPHQGQYWRALMCEQNKVAG